MFRAQISSVVRCASLLLPLSFCEVQDGEESANFVSQLSPSLQSSVLSPSSAHCETQSSRKKPHFPFVILGGGTTAYSAIEAIRQTSPKSDILVISSESVLPNLHRGDMYHNNDEGRVEIGDDFLSSYNEWRRHITSKLASEPDAYNVSEDDEDMGGGTSEGKGRVSLLLRQKDIKIDKDSKVLSLEKGGEIKFNKLLIATAGRPKSFYVLGDMVNGERIKGDGFGEDCINSLFSLSDFERLEGVIKDITETKNKKERTIVVIGGGFLGTEISLAMAKRARHHNSTSDRDAPPVKVMQIYAESAPLASYLPKYLSDDVKDRLERHGVSHITERLVTDLHVKQDETDEYGNGRSKCKMHLVGTSRSNIDADYVIMASSTISPSTEVAEASGIELDVVNGGIVVNDNFEVGNGIYAAGVVASYFDPNLGRRRVNRYDHSVNSGLLAGYNMVTSGQGEGIQVRYDHQPAVRSNLEDINVQCESVGECNSDLETVGVWIDRDRDDELKNGGELLSDVSCMSKYRRGVVYYLNNNKVTGVVLWNCSDLLERARDIIRLAPDVTDKRKLIRSIPLAPDDWLFVVRTKSRENVRNLATEDQREYLVERKFEKSNGPARKVREVGGY
ncbi:hypothetical protein TrCOL_g7534 [Triparma columacea]|uniref:FAD/NAD(P)-binding domain-containing protein n=1 Tax=Triparma columacea TaxID=722753 RepID=A0A9W7L7D1_9STRA|nr:hypothetical protein TrCOL_g7534 [Triparma columacea]